MMAASASTDLVPKEQGDCQASQKWVRLGQQWRANFLIDSHHPELGSWIDVKYGDDDSVKLGCKCCNFAGVQCGSFPNYAVSTADAMQAVNFLKHQSGPKHKHAVVCFLTGHPDPALGSPSQQEFESLCEEISNGRATCGSTKRAQMTWCISEAIKSVDQQRIQKSKAIALFRDESKGRLAVRFRSVSSDLEVHCGTLGQARDFGSGALQITKATCSVMTRFCSRFHGAPPGARMKQKTFVKKQLLNHLRRSVTTITVDAAGDEVLSCEMMRSSVLSAMQKRATPNLKYVIRDKTHGSRRLISRGWGADEFLSDVTKLFCRGRKSIARIIQNSHVVRLRFQVYCKTSFRLVKSVVVNMRAAPHRYESMQKPFGRSVIYIHGCIRTALWCTQTRSDESAASSKEWLTWIDEEKCLQAAMMADGSDQTLVLTRLLDREDVDPAIVNGEVRAYINAIEALFGQGEQCLSVYGYTRAMLETLRRPLVWNVSGTVRSIGCEEGVRRDIVVRCLDRMRCWIKLMRATVAVEFPSFEVAHVPLLNLVGVTTGSVVLFLIFLCIDCQLLLLLLLLLSLLLSSLVVYCALRLSSSTKALSVFDLSGAGNRRHDACLMENVAKAVGVNPAVFQMQFEDVLPRAVNEAAVLARVDPNKSAWREILRKIDAHQSVAASHPTDALRKCLVLYFVFGLSSSGVEQSFSKSGWGFSNRRMRALPDTEDFCLKVILDLPHHDKSRIISIARKTWVLCFGTSRIGTSKITKGVKRVRDDTAVHGAMANTEQEFVRRRRRAATAACTDGGDAADLSCDALMANANQGASLDNWSDRHEKELQFQKEKLKARMVQAVAEGSLDGCDELKNAVRTTRSNRIKDQRARVRKQVRDNVALEGITGTDLIARITGNSVCIVGNHPQCQLHASIRRLGMKVVEKHEADVFVVDKPGDPQTSIAATTGLRGSFQVTPGLLVSNGLRGVAMKWHSVAGINRVVFVSTACNDQQRPGLDYVRSILGSIQNNKIDVVVGDWAKLQELRNKFKSTPARVIAVVKSSELKLPAAILVWPSNTSELRSFHMCVLKISLLPINYTHACQFIMSAEVCVVMKRHAMTLDNWLRGILKVDASQAVSGLQVCTIAAVGV